MKNPNKLVGALLISALTISSTLPADEGAEGTSKLQRVTNGVSRGYNYAIDTVKKHPYAAGAAAIAGGAYAYRNDYAPTVQAIGAAIKPAWNGIVDTVKSGLLLNGPDQEKLRGQFLKAFYLYAFERTGKYVLRQVILNKFFPVPAIN